MTTNIRKAFGMDNQFTDLSPLIELTPRKLGVIESLNLFDIQHDNSTTVRAQRITDEQHLIEARQRQGKRNWINGVTPTEAAFIVPFFPVDANIKAVDIQNFTNLIELGTDAPMTVVNAVNRKLGQIRAAESKTKERIFTEAVMGRSYAGITAENADNYYDYYQVWGQTQQNVAIDFTSNNINPTDVIETEVRSAIIDAKMDGSTDTTLICVCGRAYFQALVTNDFLRQAYMGWNTPGVLNPLRDRIGGNVDARNWFYDGVQYIVDQSGAIGQNEAYFFPDGIANMFQAFYAPADSLDAANQTAQEFYMWMEQDHRTAHIETEFSLLAVNTRPELVVHSTVA